MRVVAVIFFLGGPVLGLLAGFLARGLENKNAAAALGEAVSERAALLERETFSVTEALYHTRAFFDSSRKVTREGFRDFTRDILTRHPVIRAIEWVPHVTEKGRANHERGARAEGLAEYRIWYPGPKRAVPRASYDTTRYAPRRVRGARAGCDSISLADCASAGQESAVFLGELKQQLTLAQ